MSTSLKSKAMLVSILFKGLVADCSNRETSVFEALITKALGGLGMIIHPYLNRERETGIERWVTAVRCNNCQCVRALILKIKLPCSHQTAVY